MQKTNPDTWTEEKHYKEMDIIAALTQRLIKQHPPRHTPPCNQD
jgi:hypothetical protein